MKGDRNLHPSQLKQHPDYSLASYHRLFSTYRMIGKLEIITGATALLAEHNGVEQVSPVRKKLVWMAINAAKYTYASNFYQMCRNLRDIAAVPIFRGWSAEWQKSRRLGGRSDI